MKRPHASVFARTGYWASARGENTSAPSPATAAVPPAVQAAVDTLADSLRPDADEPAQGWRRVLMPQPLDAAPAPLLAAPTIGVARGRTVGEAVGRREFHRTDTLVVRARLRSFGGSAGQADTGAPSVSGRLLDRRGQPLTDLPVTPDAATPELRLPLGNLGPGDYVIELTARSGDESARQFVAFRVVR